MRIGVNCMGVDPLQPHIFATGGTDPLGEWPAWAASMALG